MTGKFLKIFVKIPIGTCFFENFGKNRFTIDNRVFRVFVEIPIGKILALFYVFSATLEGWRSIWPRSIVAEKTFFDLQNALETIFPI